MSSLQLNAIEQKTLQMTSVNPVLMHDLATQQIIKVLPTSAVAGKNDIRFSLDESYLSDNSYVNKTKMRTKIEVTFTGPVSEPTYDVDTGVSPNVVFGSGVYLGNPNEATLPYLWRGETGSVTPFVTNKAFQRVILDFSGRAIDLQNRSIENIQMLAEMFSKDRLEANGIYQIDIDGRFTETVGGAVSIPILDNADTSKDNTIYPRGAELSYLRQQAFWKQNTSGRYCKVLGNRYFNNATGDVVGGYVAVESFDKLTSDPSPITNVTNFNLSLYNQGDSLGRIENLLSLTLSPLGITACGAIARQVVTFEIDEDLICDIFGTSYQDNFKPFAMSSKALNFTFSQTTRLNELFDWACPQSMAVNNTCTVAIKDMSLEFTTFKMAQDIVNTSGRTYEIPYFKENRNFETRALNTKTSTTIDLNVIQYNENPIYIRIATSIPYTEENIQAFVKNNQFLPYEKMSISIDNEIGMGLYDMSQTDVVVRTIENLSGSKAGYERMQKTHNMPSLIENYYSENGQISNQYIPLYTGGGNYKQSTKPFINFVLLRNGFDIRLPVDKHSGVKSRTNYRFKLTFPPLASLGINVPFVNGVQLTKMNADIEVSAYVPAKYTISSVTGLISNEELSMSNDQFISLVKAMYDLVGSEPSLRQSNQVFGIQEGVLLGSGWFSNLLQSARSFGQTLTAKIPAFLGSVKDFSGVVSRTSKALGQDEVSNVASAVQEALQRAGYGKTGGMNGDLMASGNYDLMASGHGKKATVSSKKKASKYA
jgi:hypothetical protein